MILLDTSTLIWWTTALEKLSKKARGIIEEEIKSGLIFVSSISIWEIYLLVKKEKVRFSTDIDTWLEKVEGSPYMNFIPVDNKIAAKSVILQDFFNNDPADRMIVSTALIHGATLITSDKKILNYKQVQTIW